MPASLIMRFNEFIQEGANSKPVKRPKVHHHSYKVHLHLRDFIWLQRRKCLIQIPPKYIYIYLLYLDFLFCCRTEESFKFYLCLQISFFIYFYYYSFGACIEHKVIQCMVHICTHIYKRTHTHTYTQTTAWKRSERQTNVFISTPDTFITYYSILLVASSFINLQLCSSWQD